MNKIYKVLWNEVKQAYVVVSEIAKNHGKKSESKLAVLTLAAAVMMGGMGGAVAQAMDPVPGYADVSQYSAVGKLENGTFTPGGYWITQGIMSALYGPYNLMAVGDNSKYPYDGVASTLVGQVNFTQNANAAIVMGAGNTVTNSYRTVTVETSELSQFMDGNKVKDIAGLKNYLQNAVKTSGGKVMAIGGANTVDNAYESQVMGVGNTLQGGAGGYDENKATRLNYIEGFYNNISGTADKPAQNDYIIGADNTITNGKNNIIFGNKREVSEKDDNIIIGSGEGDSALKTTVSNAIILGNKANATVDGGIAIGEGSIAAKAAPTEKGYGATDSDTGATWQGTAAALSVGDSTGTTKITRQITNVAAGKDETDAVNVAQLQKVAKAADAAKTHYYSVNKTVPIGQINYNYNNEGAVADGSLAAGQNTIATGIASAVTGAYSIIGDMNEPLSKSNTFFGVQGATAASYGSFNEILIDHTSGQGKPFDGVANSVFGQANKTQNANAAIIMGAGNTITNSYRDVVGLDKQGDYFDILHEAVPESGGQVMAIGGGNSADYAQQSQLMGVGNELKGTEANVSKLNYLEGFSNKAENVQNAYIIGANNSVKNGNSNIVFGDKRTMDGQSGNIIIGSGEGDNGLETKVSKAIILGNKANVTVEGGIAIGEGSIASTKAGEIGYDPSKKGASDQTTSTWKATNAAVSVGDGTNITRQITGVAAGTQETDAVNVAQLKQVAEASKYTAGDNVKIENNVISATDTTIKNSNNALSYDKKNGTLSMTVEDTKGNKATGSVQLSDIKEAVDTNTTYKVTSETTGENGVSTQTTKISLNGDDKTTSSVEVKNDTLVKGDNGLTLTGNTLSMSVKDTAGNEVKGQVDLSTLKVNDTRNTLKAGDHIALSESKHDDGSTEYTVSVKDDGKVAPGNTGLVTGDTVAKETRTSADGFVTKTTNTAGQNIQALDKQTKTNADNIAKNTESINNLNQNVTNIGNRVNNLDSKINKVGAGAAALAALHPQDFDPDDKWDFAAGFGNYRDANAMAIGAFYRPDNKTMFSVGGSMGNGENMVNVGVSLKFGKSSPYAGMSKAALINKIESQDDRIAKLEQLVQQLLEEKKEK